MFLQAVVRHNWSACVGALNSINALLPDGTLDPTQNFQVKVSTKMYNEKMNLKSMLVCNHCTEEYENSEGKQDTRNSQFEFNTIRVFDLIVPVTDRLIMDQNLEKIWICPKCKKDNKLVQTKIIKQKYLEPFFLGVVSNPPELKNRVSDRNTYDREMNKWLWNFKNELDYKMALFRAANWKSGDGENEYSDIDTSIEEASNDI